jgi:hypothetical protein
MPRAYRDISSFQTRSITQQDFCLGKIARGMLDEFARVTLTRMTVAVLPILWKKGDR